MTEGTGMTYRSIGTQLQQRVAVIWLNRPDVRNAMDDVLIDELADALERAMDDDDVRAIVLAGHGTAFCAGADLGGLRRARDMTPEEAVIDSSRLAQLLQTLYEGDKPSVARVHGPAIAGGVGLVAACDIAVASTEATFALSEVKLGLVPSIASPYVIRAIGEANARRYFLTGETFDAAEAYRIGLVHDIAPPEELDGTVNAILGHLVDGGPEAMRECKALIRTVSGQRIDALLSQDTAARVARRRASDEAQEGIASFLEKRAPRWAQPS